MKTQGIQGIAARVLLAIVFLLPVFAFSQDGSYRLQPEDVIHVQVYNEPQVTGDFEIAIDGNVSLPFVGIVRAVGKTTAELEQELKNLYIQKLRLRDPIVSVTVTRFRIRRASVSGAVRNAGAYPFREGETLLTLLALAGGPVDGVADLRRARLRRAGSSEEIPVDLEAIYDSGDPTQNYKLMDGDELIVPRDNHNRVVVWGAVQQPGTFPYAKGMRVMDAIGLTRGEIRNVSRMSKIVILRKRKGQYDVAYPIRVDLVAFMNKHDWRQNVELEREDFIFVPSTKTPNMQDVGAILNTVFFANRVFFEEGIFGFRPLSIIGR